MAEFIEFKRALQKNLKELLSNKTLYKTSASKEDLWNAYLSFPEEVRQEFNCNCCKQFIREIGGVVVINSDLSVKSIWGFEFHDPMYQAVLDKLDQLVISSEIVNLYGTKSAKVGTDYNFEDASTKWEHLFYVLPSETLTSPQRGMTMEAHLTEVRQSKEVFRRALDEIPMSATQTVLDLIAQGSLYRGEESKARLEKFLKCQREYSALKEGAKDNFCWVAAMKDKTGVLTRIRNSAIGTLLVNICEGDDLDTAVRKFENVVAPQNYKRPNPIVTPAMIEDAEKTLKELGLDKSIQRRFAVMDDLPVQNTLFIDRDVNSEDKSIFSQLAEQVVVNPKTLKKVEEISVQDFISNVLPTARHIRFLLENQHSNRMCSLIAPVNADAPSVLKWENQFSWCYAENMADSSIRQKVQRAGGKVEGLLRVSLSWHSRTDLDLHIVEPRTEIYYGCKRSPYSGGHLDVDMNVGGESTDPVENIIYPYGARFDEGKTYEIYVHNYRDRNGADNPFEVEVEVGGSTYTFEYRKPIRCDEKVVVGSFKVINGSIEISMNATINSSVVSKNVWNLDTYKFHPVSAIAYSPNHWQEPVGNKHIMFYLKGCENPEEARGIFNEFLIEDLLRQHKRVFELLGAKMKVEKPHSAQLSGVGFSTTGGGSFYVEVESSFKRVLKVKV